MGKHTCQEFLFDLDGLCNNTLDNIRARLMLQMAEEEARKVSAHPFMVADEFVREGETGHEAVLLQPKDRGKRTRKKDVLDSSKGN